MSLKKVISQIRKYKNFLITSHVNLEADAVGSQLAFLYLLKKLHKSAFIVNEGNVPVECRFLPGIDKIRKPHNNIGRFECAVFLDCSDSSRAGGATKLIAANIATINIDHHLSNARFATSNWVDPGASCACEMVYRLFKLFKVAINPEAAIQLYSGIVGDTGSFRFNNTSPACHKISAFLLGKGVSAAKVYSGLYEVNSFEDIKLLGSVLTRINRDRTRKIVWADITPAAFSSKLTESDLSEITLGLLRSIKGIELAIVFKEAKGTNGRVRINFRSQTIFDCNMLASRFGGGGHRNASGATISGDPQAIKKNVLKAAKRLIRNYV